MGGTSPERDISLLSGNAVLKALQEAGVDAIAFDPAEQPVFELPELGIDRVFIALHGIHGEDGTVQGALDLLNIPYTGSGVMASALSMDKLRTKRMWRAIGLPTPNAIYITPDSDVDRVIGMLGLPLILKPNNGGSALGLVKVTEKSQFWPAYEVAKAQGSGVLAETFVQGDEYTGTVLNGEVLPLVKIEAPDGNYDYEHKYFSDETRYICPVKLDEAIEKELREMMLEAYTTLGCRGLGRVDFLLLEDGSASLLEMNTSPGMTAHSLAPMAAKAAGIDFTELVITLLENARVG